MEKPQILRLGSMTSTQDVARELPIGSVVVADHQTAGRGRLSHRWEAPPGTALLVSFVLRPDPHLSLAVGVAAAEACGKDVRLKWPNDLLLSGRKVGGILIESSASKAICGIGINLTWAPDGAARLDESRDQLLDRLRPAVEHWASAPATQVIARWRDLSDTIGKKVRIEVGDRVVDATGSLVVDGVHVSAGSLTILSG